MLCRLTEPKLYSCLEIRNAFGQVCIHVFIRGSIIRVVIPSSTSIIYIIIYDTDSTALLHKPCCIVEFPEFTGLLGGPAKAQKQCFMD